MATYSPPKERKINVHITNNGGHFYYQAMDNFGESIQGIAPTKEIAQRRIDAFSNKKPLASE